MSAGHLFGHDPGLVEFLEQPVHVRNRGAAARGNAASPRAVNQVGVVPFRRGHGLNATFTVRRISYGEGVERVFPLHSPRVDKVEVERHGDVRRAKLTYLRKRIGKGATLVKEMEKKAAVPAAK